MNDRPTSVHILSPVFPLKTTIKTLSIFLQIIIGFSVELLYVLLGYFCMDNITCVLFMHCIMFLGRAAQQKTICTILKDVVYTPGSYMVKF